MKRITILIFFFLTAFISKAQLVSETRQSNSFSLSGTVIYVDNTDDARVKYWMVNPRVDLQKLVLDFGGLKPGYLGPPETIK